MKTVFFIAVALFSLQTAADQNCHKSGETYTAENMNLPACDETGDGQVWGSSSSFNQGNGSMGSTWGAGSTGSGGSAAPGAQGAHSSTGSGWEAGGTGSGWRPGTTGSGNERDPASLPTQNSQMADQLQNQQTAPATTGGDANNTLKNSGDAKWIK